jgi:hypothetical protein
MLGGVDLATGARFIELCRLPGNGPQSKGGPYVILMSGDFPADILEKAARANDPPLALQWIDGSRVLGHDRNWIARRGVNPLTGELVIASDLGVMRATLSGHAASYAIDPTAPISLVMAPSEIARLLPSRQGDQPSPVAAVRELRATLEPGAKALNATFVVGSDDASRQLAAGLEPTLAVLAKQIAGGGTAAAPRIEVRREGGDVRARIELPAAALEALAARVTAARPRTRQ